MASSDSNDFKHTSSTPTSSFQKTVCLQSWWLVKAERNSHGRRLAVAGFTSREQQAVRLFSSAPILKRYDVFTVETVDGICVVIKGFIDKARTEANGFPSEVFQHFVFGFPPYWEECAEKCFGEDSMTEALGGSNPGLEKAFPQSALAGAGESSQRSPTDSEKATSEKAHEGGRKKNLGEKSSSKMDRMEKSRLKSGERKSYVVLLPQDSEVAVGCPDNSSHGLHNSSVTSTMDGRSEMPRTRLGNMSMEHLIPSRSKGNAITPSTSDMNVNITRSDAEIRGNYTIKNLKDQNIKNPISACCTSNTKEPNSMSKAYQEKSKVRSIKNLAKQLKIDFIGEIDSPDEISSHCSGRVLRSSSKLKGSKKDDHVSARVLEKEKGVSVSVSMDGSDKEEQGVASVDSVSGGTSFLNLPDAGNQYLMNETTPRKPDSTPSRDNFEQNAKFSCKGKNPKEDQNHGEIMTESSIWKGMNKASTASRNYTSVKNKEKIAIGSKESDFENAHASGGEAKRKLAYETPVSEKANEQVPTASPESVTCKRSRSGRLLLPALEFWRNQIAVYDADRKITGIKAVLHLEHPYKGSKSEPPRKKMQLK